MQVLKKCATNRIVEYLFVLGIVLHFFMQCANLHTGNYQNSSPFQAIYSNNQTVETNNFLNIYNWKQKKTISGNAFFTPYSSFYHLLFQNISYKIQFDQLSLKTDHYIQILNLHLFGSMPHIYLKPLSRITKG